MQMNLSYVTFAAGSSAAVLAACRVSELLRRRVPLPRPIERLADNAFPVFLLVRRVCMGRNGGEGGSFRAHVAWP